MKRLLALLLILSLFFAGCVTQKERIISERNCIHECEGMSGEFVEHSLVTTAQSFCICDFENETVDLWETDKGIWGLTK